MPPACARLLHLPWLIATLCSVPLSAELTLPAVFGDHMVLQRHQAVPIWGTAHPGALVIVRFGEQVVHTTADPTGAWRVRLASMDADATPRTLTVETQNRDSPIENQKFQDVLVGEVWLCAGQSNMEMALGVPASGAEPYTKDDPELARELPTMDYPAIRLLKVSQQSREDGILRTHGWSQAHGDALARFSATGFFFGQRLRTELNVPVGLILSAWGGSALEEWISDADYAPLEQILGSDAERGFARRPDFVGRNWDVMLAPLAPYALRGVIWYQGEANLLFYRDGERYADKFAALVSGWRRHWTRPELPFYAVQIAPFNYSSFRPNVRFEPDDLPRLWRGQRLAAEQVSHTGLVPSADTVTDVTNIHPGGKRTIGQRLAALALNRTYGRSQVPATGPVMDRVAFTARGAVVHFRGAPNGLVTTDGQPPANFELAGDDGQFLPADATIEGSTVILVCPDIARPAAVRYCWHETARPNLANTAGWPAYAFRSAQATPE